MREVPSEDLAQHIRRRHCLSVLARSLGFRGWQHLTEACTNGGSVDFGTLFYPEKCWVHWNIWSASYEEAKGIRRKHGGFLLPYRHQFVIVEDHFIQTLGLDPHHEDWVRVGQDLVDPDDAEARTRLVADTIRLRLQDLLLPS